MKPAAHWSSTTFSHIFTVWLSYLLGLCTSPLLLENQHQHICSMIVFNSQFKNSTALSLCQISHLHRFAIWATCTSTLHPLHSCPHFLFINTLHFLDHQPSSITPPPPLSHFSSFSSKYPIQPLQHTTFTRRHISTSILNPNLLHILSSPSCKSFFSLSLLRRSNRLMNEWKDSILQSRSTRHCRWKWPRNRWEKALTRLPCDDCGQGTVGIKVWRCWASEARSYILTHEKRKHTNVAQKRTPCSYDFLSQIYRCRLQWARGSEAPPSINVAIHRPIKSFLTNSTEFLFLFSSFFLPLFLIFRLFGYHKFSSSLSKLTAKLILYNRYMS